MINEKVLLDYVNNELNENAPENAKFQIYADGGDYEPPTWENNKLTTYIQGVGRIADSSILPVKGLSIATQTLSVVLVVKVDPSKPIEDSVKDVLDALTAFISAPKVEAMTDESGREYSVSVYGSSPSAGELVQRPNIGLSITYSINVYFSFIENGINSLDCILTFEGEQVPYTEMTVSMSPVLDGGAVSGTNGGVGNYATSYAFQIQASVPALKGSKLTEAFAKYLLKKEYGVYDVTLTYGGIKGEYRMIFATSNITSRGVESIGQSVTLVEAIEFDKLAK